VEEYLQASWWKRLSYRFFRHPLVLLGLGPFFTFLITPRFPTPSSSKTDRRSILLTDLALLAVFTVMSLLIGVKEYLIIQVPVMWLAGAAGIWMFYVQHQFEYTYWAHSSDWDYTQAALHGASFYHLPRILQWFTGNIGFHHIHHLSPRIPNYYLEKCFKENPALKPPFIIGVRTALKSLSLRLWDEQAQRMVGFGALSTRPDSSA
jgi:omega-6 fatty acid desaturase (delta-12 desaturase)